MKIKVKVQPNSGRREVLKVGENEYKVFLKKQPEDGKANIELEKVLKKHFSSVASRATYPLNKTSSNSIWYRVKIIKGFTSKNKVVEIM